MAVPDNRTWLMALATALIFVDSVQCDLMLIMDRDLRNVSKDFCGRLHCWNQGNFNNTISTISGISIYDISQPQFDILLASVPNDGSGMKINQYLISDITGAGSIDGFNAGLSVNFKNPQDCEFGSFLCELEYVDVNGKRDTMTAEDRASSSNKCTCNAIKSQLLKLTGQVENTTQLINSLSQDNTGLSTELSDLRQQNSDLLLEFQNLSSQVSQIQDYLTSFQTSPPTSTRSTPPAFGSECSRGMEHSSPRVKFLLWGQIPALCDADTDGGGWVILQRRISGNVDFYRDWQSYKTGFGTPDTDFWLGNEVIHNLTSRGNNEFRVDMTYRNVQYYAQYNFFSVDNEQQNYRLTLSGYKGNAGDSLAYHNNMMFSTYDRDNDRDSSRHCAEVLRGAWWHDACYYSNLNGAWGVNGKTGVCWNALDSSTSLSFTELKVRLVHTC